jgi:hypothetical protein
MAIGYKLNWEEVSFKGSEIFECKEFPSVFTWVEDNKTYLRIGEKLYERRGCKEINFKLAEEFIVRKFKEAIENFETRAPHGHSNDSDAYKILKELEDLNLLVQCMFK